MNDKRKPPQIIFLALALILVCALILAQAGPSAAGPEQIDAGPKVYWSDEENGRIWRANLDGSQKELLSGYLSRPESLALNQHGQMFLVLDQYVIERLDLKGMQERIVGGYPWLSRPNSLAITHGRNTLYWTDNGKPAIGQIDLDSGEIHYQLPLGPNEADGLALDEAQGKIYWLRHDRLNRANLDGSDMIFFPDLYGLTDFDLDLNGGKIYFATAFSGYNIMRANLDGSEVETLASYKDGRCDGITLDLEQGQVYWSERGSTPRILRANLDGTEPETIVDEKIFGPFGLALDSAAGKLYWADWVAQKIQRANLDGSNIEDLVRTVPARPRFLTLDPGAGKMFWTGDREAAVWQADLDGQNNRPLVPGSDDSSSGGIALHKASGRLYWVDDKNEAVTRAQVDGTGIKQVIYRRLWDPQGLALDETAGKMYWADREQNQILRANLDGTGSKVLIDQGLDTPTSLALDLLRGKMVWTDPIARQIGRANLDGSGAEVLLTEADGLLRPNLVALDVSAGKMYWTDYGSKSLRRADLDGSNIEDLVTSGIELPSGLALRIPLLDLHRSYVPLVSGN